MIKDRFSSSLNVARFLAKDPSRLKILLKKVAKRLSGETDHGSAGNNAWIEANSVPASEIAEALDQKLWKEALKFGDEFQALAKRVLSDIPHDLGGGSHHIFLYWLTRYSKPRAIVETGVAAGWSSRAFLAAIAKNGSGRLYSSDLPYFRLPRPERFIGILVEEDLRSGWSLLIDSDEVNLPRILAETEVVDLLHYDSDKMASGREFAVRLVSDKLSPRGTIIMDDIWNDDWFRTYVTANDLSNCVIDGRYGVIGELAAQFQRAKSPSS